MNEIKFYCFSVKKMLFFIMMVSFSSGVISMGVFSKKVNLFTGMEGVITHMGEPVSNVKMLFTTEYLGEKREEYLETDENGRFKIDPVFDKRSKLSLAQFVSHQRIFVYFKGEEITIWGGAKLDWEEYDEYGGVPKNIACELTEDIRKVNLESGGFIGTNCHWRVDN